MILRYETPEMAQLWHPVEKLRTWVQVELAVVWALEQQQLVAPGTHQALQQATAKLSDEVLFDLPAIAAIEAETRHDVIAFLTHYSNCLGEENPHKRWLHWGMTSTDLVDTALSLQLQQASSLITIELEALCTALKTLANAHRHTFMMGRTHGVHAEPMVFGVKVLGWLDDCQRAQERLQQAQARMAVGKISGAVGTYTQLPPQVEAMACEKLNLRAAPFSTQVLSRDYWADWVAQAAILASVIEKITTEIRHLQRTEVLELEEPFHSGQKGSSAMPHKRNPIQCENLTGLARLVRASILPALENIALWHERDISHSSTERVYLPDTTTLLHFMLRRLTGVIAGLQVYPQAMQHNMERTGGVIFSQRVLLALVEAGLAREAAYALVQPIAQQTWLERRDNPQAPDFISRLQASRAVTAHLSREALAACADLNHYTQHTPVLFARYGL